jgi:hypothetical protein
MWARCCASGARFSSSRARAGSRPPRSPCPTRIEGRFGGPQSSSRVPSIQACQTSRLGQQNGQQTSETGFAQPCGMGSARTRESRMNRAITRTSSPIVGTPKAACHAGGRGFEPRRSRPAFPLGQRFGASLRDCRGRGCQPQGLPRPRNQLSGARGACPSDQPAASRRFCPRYSAGVRLEFARSWSAAAQSRRSSSGRSVVVICRR